MSEEEKKAIEYLKARLYGNKGCKFIDVAQSDLRIFIKLVDRILKDDKNWQKIYDEQEENIREKNNKICELEFIIENQQKELEHYKRLAEMNLKDSEEFKENMCEHRCILNNQIMELTEELNNLKEIEKTHQKENGKLRVEFEKVYEDNLTLAHELEQEKEKNNNLIKQLQEQNTEIQDISRQLRQEKEKNKELEEKLKIAVAIITKGMYPEQNEGDNDFDKQFISKDKIKEKIEETNSEKLNYSEEEYYLENEVKGYAIDKLKELLEEK